MSKHLHRPLLVGFLLMTAAVAAGQVNTARPGQLVERHLSGDQTFREWSYTADRADDIKRIKVCRVETVCKMRFKEGHTPRTRVRNLVAPLRYEGESIPISEGLTSQVRQALDNLRDKQGVTVRFIGYTDDAPLTGRDESTYGDHLSLSKARAQRVALDMQEALGLPPSAIESDGRGATNPLASSKPAASRSARCARALRCRRERPSNQRRSASATYPPSTSSPSSSRPPPRPSERSAAIHSDADSAGVTGTPA